jgi:inorganic pyrophosphatase
VLVLGEEPTFPGCIMTVRLLGIIEAEQTSGKKTIRNDRLLATPENDKIHPRIHSLSDIPSEKVDAIEHFFIAYNAAEGRRFVPLRRRGPDEAIRRVAHGIRAASSARSGDAT